MCLLRTAIQLDSSRIEDLIAATSLSRDLVELVVARMQRSGIWVNGEVDLEELLVSPLEELEVLCHLLWLVARGEVIRTGDRRDERYIYAWVGADADG